MNIRFDVFWLENLGTIYKDNSIDVDGIEASVNLNLNEVNYIYVEFKVGENSYTDTVTIKDIDKGLVVVPFKTDVIKQGLNQFELVAVMKNGDVKPSQTFQYNIEKSLENPNSIQAETNYPILVDLIEKVSDLLDEIIENGSHSHNNLEALEKITSEKIEKWDNHNHNENYYTKNESYNKKEVDATISKVSLDIDNKLSEKSNKNHNHNGIYSDIGHSHTDYVTKVDGKVLSSNDYTNEDKNKLKGLENYNHPATHNASMIVEDASHRFVTDIEKGKWGSKAEADHNHNTLYASKANEHTHSNKASIDKVTEAKILSWDSKSDSTHNHNTLYAAKSSEHIHNNKAAIDTITNSKISEWDSKEVKGHKHNEYLTELPTHTHNEYLTELPTHSHSYNSLTELPNIPSKVSELQNDSGFITSADLDTSQNHVHSNKTVLDEITGAKVEEWNNKEVKGHNHSYNDLTDKPNIPPTYQLPIATPTTLGGVKVGTGLSISNGILSANNTDLSNYFNKTEINDLLDKKISAPLESVSNLNTFLVNGYRKTTASTSNMPSGGSWGVVLNVMENLAGKTGFQFYYGCSGTLKGQTWLRFVENNNWGTWSKLSTFSGNYGDLANIPTTFPPSSHRHSASEIDDLPTGGGVDVLTSNNTWTGENKFNNLVTFERNNEVQRMQPSTSNNACYYAFYKNKTNRSGYFGYESSYSNDFVIANESSNASINLKTNGSGQVQVNGKEIAKKEDITNAIGSHRIWSGTQSQYDAIPAKDNNTLYFIKEG